MEIWKGVFLCLSWLAVLGAQHAPSNSLFYECNATGIGLAIKVDPLGTGYMLDPLSLHLGSCLYSSITELKGYIVFEYKLRDCGFSRLTSGAKVEYFTNLVYSPPLNKERYYSKSINERINCTSYRKLSPTPTPLSNIVAQLSGFGHLIFQSRLMNQDFSSPSNTSVYPLGSPINVEFTVQSSFHQPMKIYIEESTAAPSRNLSTASLNYSVINNHGCFMDGKVAASKFMPRPTDGSIRLSLQAFQFTNRDSDIYLHFTVLVWDPKMLTDPTKKACSFNRDTGRWEHLDDSSLSSICNCCDFVCQSSESRRHKRDLEDFEDLDGLVHTVVLGPIMVQTFGPKVGNFVWDTLNGSRMTNASREKYPSAVPPAVGALLMEAALFLLLCLGVCLYTRWGHNPFQNLDGASAPLIQ
ncbi:zona pellucida sperm-binding protein 3 isoform X2 [Microcaecilia unicolor]|uniref:Zona pellucida sperm-binding protein 3-like isoform X2 n=1 Tax=Microcaecilia unicolor TaxID=1415580 RepID=A0A6P7Z6P2_9AMPH|nr:zona pellucida sperm-binding protein 3-like isoform X2 [Microcaecilia unicolor]